MVITKPDREPDFAFTEHSYTMSFWIAEMVQSNVINTDGYDDVWYYLHALPNDELGWSSQKYNTIVPFKDETIDSKYQDYLANKEINKILLGE